MADDVADHKTLTKHQKIKILKSFDNAILKNKQSHNKVLQDMILEFKGLPSGKNIPEIF